MNPQDALRSALERGAAGVGDDHPLTLDDVKGRARGLRRRRAAVAGAATLAVVALAVPVGLSLTDDVVSGPELDPAGPAPTEPVETPADPTELLLTTERPTGATAPGVDYLYRGEIHVAGDEATVPVGPYYYAFAPFGDGWIGLRTSGPTDALDVLDADGRVVDSHPAAGTPTLSPDGTVLAYPAPGGRIMTLVAGGQPEEIHDGESPVFPVAVAGSESCDDESAGGGCAVWFNDDASSRAYSVTTKGILGEVPGVIRLNDVAADGRTTGLVEADDYGSCSALIGVDGEPAWQTCEHMLGEFSPDGRLVVGYPAYRDGAGDGSVAILDAATGDVLAEATNDETTQAFAAGTRWDVDGTLLIPVAQDGTWALMRLTPEGVLTRVVERDFDSSDASVSDLVLAVGP